MDTKRLITTVTLTLALVLGYQLFMQHEKTVHPGWFKDDAKTDTDATTAPTTQEAVGPTTLPDAAVAGATTNPVAAAISTGLAAIGTNEPVPSTLGTDSATFPMVLAVDPQGAGLKSVILSGFYDDAAHKDAQDKTHLYKFQEPLAGFESITRPFATRTVTINGTDKDISNVIWKLTESSQSSVTYTATVLDSGLPAVELSKSFTLLPHNAPDGSEGYDVAFHQSFRNLTVKPVKVSVTLNGPTPPRESDLSEDRRYVAGYDAGDKYVEAGSTLVSELKKDKPTKDMIAADARPTLWIGVCNSYFESIIRPDYSGLSVAAPVKIASAVVASIDADITGKDGKKIESPTSLSIYTNDFVLSPGASAPLDLHVFFGPKQRKLLENTYYSKFPLWYAQTMVYSSGICGYITFNWLITLLGGILWFFHLIFRDWGLAIIGLVCLVRLLLHPITKKSQINMLSMGKMAPEIERLKKKYGDNKDELNKAMMSVYKEQGMTPILGCLPMFLQTPIWIALWSALQSTFELRQAGFLRWGHLHLTWINDLSHPDSLIAFSQPISILGFFQVHSLNLLPILLAVVFFIQQHMQPMPGNMTPEQTQQRKMMKWMSLLFPVMLYSRAAGLSLYIFTSTSIGIVENKIIRDHIKQRDEAEKSGKIIIDAGPTRNSKKRKDDTNEKTAAKPTGRIGKFIADMQAKAEEVRRDAERRGKDRA